MTLFEQNRTTMATFKVGQNVALHRRPVTDEGREYGYISGFELNSVGEVILVVNIASLYGSKVDKFHPDNKITIVEPL